MEISIFGITLTDWERSRWSGMSCEVWIRRRKSPSDRATPLFIIQYPGNKFRVAFFDELRAVSQTFSAVYPQDFSNVEEAKTSLDRFLTCMNQAYVFT